MKRKLKLIGISQAGWFANGVDSMGNKMSVTSYEVNELPPKDWMEHEGCVVIDGRKTDINAVIDSCYEGPLLDVTLPKGSVSKFLDVGCCEYEGESLWCFDAVSLDVYVGLKKQAGYKVGKIVDGKVEW